MGIANIEGEKKIIADSFSRSAHRYDQSAKIQQKTGNKLLKVMKPIVVGSYKRISVIADIGCGTGYFSEKLISDYQPDKYIGIDLAQGMLDVAASNNKLLKSQSENKIEWLCDDVENLSLIDNSVDIIYANFSLQWCENVPLLLKNFNRILKPGGLCCFTSLGSKTLYELRYAWSVVDNLPHVNRFYDKEYWAAAIKKRKFSLLFQYQIKSIMYYPSVRKLLWSLKNIGANTVKNKVYKSLMGKQRFMNFIEAYEHCRLPKGLPVTYEIDGWILKNQDLMG